MVASGTGLRYDHQIHKRTNGSYEHPFSDQSRSMNVSSTFTSDRPAILGGDKAVTIDGTDANRWPIIGDEEVAAVTEVLRSGELSLNPVTQQLEEDYRSFLGVKHALAYCNATSAIFASLHSFNLKPGDEVLVPSSTYWASVMPVLWCGAVPIFCESERDRMGLDPDDVESKITDKTRAMVIVHLWGMPSKMERLLAIAKENNLKVLEDSSHAIGAKWQGKPVGTLGDVGVFSLQTNKLAPAGEGGILVTNNDDIHEHAVCLGHFERVYYLKTAARRFAGTGFGLKHRMAPLSAAVARVQLKHLAERNRRRNENIIYLSKKLEPLGINCCMPSADDDIERVYFEFIACHHESNTKLKTDRLVAALKAEGCKVEFPRYPLLHQQPIFIEDHFIDIARLHHIPRNNLPKYRADDLPDTIAGNNCILRLPPFPNADRALLDQYAHAFEKVIKASSEITDQTVAKLC